MSEPDAADVGLGYDPGQGGDSSQGRGHGSTTVSGTDPRRMRRTSIRTFTPDDTDAVRAVMEASLAADRLPGFTRSIIERALLRIVPDPGHTAVAIEDGQVVGYATPNHDDLTVHPEHRRRGHGRRLFEAAVAIARQQDQDELQLYVPQHLPASVAFAEAVGLRYHSSMWHFRLPGDVVVPDAAFPSDVRTRPWDPARDVDFEGWVAFLIESFQGHPTTPIWSASVIRHIHAAPDFDPTEILIVSSVDEPDRPIAFTRIDLADEPGGRVGEVGLIGVLPAWRRRGLGRELLRWGVTELRARGARDVELSVEATNDGATALYRAHGFEPAIEWPHWVIRTR